MKRNIYIFILAALFLAVAQLLTRFGFWAAAGLPEPRGYVYQGILFLGTVFLLQNTLFGPYLNVLEERDLQTIHKKAKAEKTREQSEQMVGDYRRAIEEARIRATVERERLALAAEQEERDKLREARERAGKELSARVEDLEGEARGLKPQLRGQVEGLAQDILNQVVASKAPNRGGKTAGPQEHHEGDLSGMFRTIFLILSPLPALAGDAGEQAAGLDIWSVINFVILVGALAFVLRKPLAQMFQGKRDSVRKAVDEAEGLRVSAEARHAEYSGKLAQLDSEISQIVKDARDAGEHEKQEILERARRMAERIAEDGKLAAEKERLRVLGELEKETMAEAMRKAEQLLRDRVTETEHRMFTNELITSLEEGPNAGR